MKKIFPYLIAIVLGYLVSRIIFDYKSYNLIGFQLGVYNSRELATQYQKKYPSSILIKDEEVYRLFYSVLSNEKVISKMEDYLNDNKISYYKKNVVVSDSGLINALNKYEISMLDVDGDAFKLINETIMESYGGEI